MPFRGIILNQSGGFGLHRGDHLRNTLSRSTLFKRTLFRNILFRNTLLRNILLKSILLRSTLLGNTFLRNTLFENALLRSVGVHDFMTDVSPSTNAILLIQQLAHISESM
ncbi:hypothetical protein F4805DRAFT_317527 [Annulohypoxylon moriforme]|nr:hypothetical protein F4805DRAFT_317527 [Annulohypoxylon moriforme]